VEAGAALRKVRAACPRLSDNDCKALLWCAVERGRLSNYRPPETVLEAPPRVADGRSEVAVLTPAFWEKALFSEQDLDRELSNGARGLLSLAPVASWPRSAEGVWLDSEAFDAAVRAAASGGDPPTSDEPVEDVPWIDGWVAIAKARRLQPALGGDEVQRRLLGLIEASKLRHVRFMPGHPIYSLPRERDGGVLTPWPPHWWNLVRLDEREVEEAFAPARTGTAGRPSSMHLIKAEMERRAADGALSGSLEKEASALVGWHKRTHPALACPTEKTVKNSLRRDYRRLRDG
jgi:hypothetical protein